MTNEHRKHELWARIASDKYPALSVHELRDLRLQAAVDYSLANDSELGQLYEQFVIMRALTIRVEE